MTYLRKSEVSVERISVCNIIEKLMGRSMHWLPCFYTNDVINATVPSMTSYWFQSDEVTSSGCHSVKEFSTIVSFTPVTMVTDLLCHLTYNSSGAWHKQYAML